MRIDATNSTDGKFVLGLYKTSGDEIVSVPSVLNLDLVLHTIDPDSIAVAAAILFRGRLERSRIDSPLVSRQCADGLTDYFGSEAPSLPVSSDIFQSRAPHQNTLVFPADISWESYLPQPAGMGRSISVNILDSNRWTGRLFTMDKLLVGSNLSWFSHRLGIPEYIAKIAFGILISGEWNARRLLVEVPANSLFEEPMRMIQKLASSIDIELRFSADLADYGKNVDE